MDPALTVVSDYSASAQLAMWQLSVLRRPWIYWGEIPGFAKRGALGRWARRRLQTPLIFASGIAGIGRRAEAAY